MIDFAGVVLIDSLHVIRVRFEELLALTRPAIIAKTKMCSKL
jgi:hypothetical protein